MKRIVVFALVFLLIDLSSSHHSVAQQKESRPTDLPGPEMEQAALTFVETYHASRLDDFRRMKIAQPEQYARTITDIWRRAEQLSILQKEDPQRYDMEIRQERLDEKTFVLAQTSRTAKEEKEKQNTRQQLEASVNEQFDLREQIKEAEVKRMDGELQRVKEKLKQRRANKSEIVKQRINQLLNAGSGLEWE